MQAVLSSPTQTLSRPMRGNLVGGSLIALAIAFNLPFMQLARVFDYPGILRQPPSEILSAFASGGTSLILTWYAFALAAILFMPATMAHALGIGRIVRFPALAISAAVAGSLAGLVQAMGLLRWVMVVPSLAQSDDTAGFALLHAFAGVALGEHLGQLLTAFSIVLIAAMQWREARQSTAVLGAVATLAILLGAFEGVALAIGADGNLFGQSAVAGYMLLTAWMITSGIGLIRRP